jgi:hypothetical protein
VPAAAKIAIWVVVFAACAVAGAVVAAHTDPFPPGVEDPGARPPASTSGPPEPVSVQRWRGTWRSETVHRFHVGGSCRTRWRATLAFTVDAGRIRGETTAVLDGEAQCDFPVAQVQAKAIRVAVRGVEERRRLRPRFSELGRDPVGSHDLGGLTNTVRAIRPVLSISGRNPTTATGRATETAPDGDLGTYESMSTFDLTCVSGC